MYCVEYISKWSDSKEKMVIKIDTLFENGNKNITDIQNIKVKYNNRGNIIEWIDKEVLRNNIMKFEFVYDTNENVIEKRLYHGKKLQYMITYNYRPDGLINTERTSSKNYNYSKEYQYEFYE